MLHSFLFHLKKLKNLLILSIRLFLPYTSNFYIIFNAYGDWVLVIGIGPDTQFTDRLKNSNLNKTKKPINKNIYEINFT